MLIVCSEWKVSFQVLAYVRRHTDPGICPLGGNSVGSDRVFLQKHMPTFEKHLHYRNIDVSSIKEVVLFFSKVEKFVLLRLVVFHQLLMDDLFGRHISVGETMVPRPICKEAAKRKYPPSTW